MKRTLLLLIGCLVVFTGACGSDVDDEGGGPAGFVDDGGNVKPGEGDESDYCADFGWYSDGTCDDFCLLPDPDCGGSDGGPSPCRGSDCEPDPVPGPGDPPPEPDPDPDPDPIPPPEPNCVPRDGAYEEISDSPEECSRIRFTCPEGQEPISDDCGCGCLEPAGTGPVACFVENDTVVRVGNSVEECAMIDFDCGAGWDYFADDCGCGCMLNGNLCYDDTSQNVQRYGDPDECTLIDYFCEDGWDYFSDDCGCGCKRPDVCLSDGDCVNGGSCEPIYCPDVEGEPCPNESQCVVF